MCSTASICMANLALYCAWFLMAFERGQTASTEPIVPDKGVSLRYRLVEEGWAFVQFVWIIVDRAGCGICGQHACGSLWIVWRFCWLFRFGVLC